ncbi:MAG: hypothetical protein ACPGU1_22895 [Myxococcota bacterium]
MRPRHHSHGLPSTLLALALLTACAGDATTEGDTSAPPTQADTQADTEAQADTESPGQTDASTGEVAEPLCDEGEALCSEDARTLSRCVAGAWETTTCPDDQGRLCEDGACVEPWRWGAPSWSTCDDEPLATAESLSDKAAHFDAIATRLHIHPEMPWIMTVRLKTEEVPCEGDATPPCTAPVATEGEATWEDVAQWHTNENDGLWSGLYLTSQAFRYAVTGSEEALETVRTLLAGEVERMAITGVSGLFTRQLIPPGVDGISCPTSLEDYVPDGNKDDNQWVMVSEAGCVQVTDKETLAWVDTDHCGLEAFAGYCWLDNVSQDEYAGHMLALAAIARVVDVPDVRDTAIALIEQVADHLVANDMAFIDWDGRVTEHGKLWVTSFSGTPGFLASQSLAFLKMAVELTGREDLKTFYEGCLLQEGDKAQGKCLGHGLETGEPYLDYLTNVLAYMGDEGCKSNYNGFSMAMTYFFELLWFEHDPVRQAHVQQVFDEGLFRADSPRALIGQENAWFNVMWAATKRLGPDSDGPAYDAVHDAVCSLRQFPASKVRVTKDPGATYPHYCDGRLGNSQSEHPIPVAERCLSRFAWWASPYDRGGCQADPSEITHPGDYLISYWMARYFGMVPEDL